MEPWHEWLTCIVWDIVVGVEVANIDWVNHVLVPDLAVVRVMQDIVQHIGVDVLIHSADLGTWWSLNKKSLMVRCVWSVIKPLTRELRAKVCRKKTWCSLDKESGMFLSLMVWCVSLNLWVQGWRQVCRKGTWCSLNKTSGILHSVMV